MFVFHVFSRHEWVADEESRSVSSTNFRHEEGSMN